MGKAFLLFIVVMGLSFAELSFAGCTTTPIFSGNSNVVTGEVGGSYEVRACTPKEEEAVNQLRIVSVWYIAQWKECSTTSNPVRCRDEIHKSYWEQKKAALDLLNSMKAKSPEETRHAQDGNNTMPIGIVSKEWDQKRAAVDNILKQGPKGMITLIKILREDSDWEKRSLAAYGLRQFKDSQEVQRALILALADIHPYVRRDAIGSLRDAGMWSSDVVDALTHIMRTDDFGFIRSQAALSLGFIRPTTDRIVQNLIDALIGTSIEGRFGAADALSEIGPAAKKALPALVHALELQDWEYQIYDVINAFLRIGETPVEAVPGIIRSMEGKDIYICSVASQALKQAGVSAVPQLEKAMKSSDQYVRMGSALALSQMNYSGNLKTEVEKAVREFKEEQLRDFPHDDE